MPATSPRHAGGRPRALLADLEMPVEFETLLRRMGSLRQASRFNSRPMMLRYASEA